jgi:hypothetical protein
VRTGLLRNVLCLPPGRMAIAGRREDVKQAYVRRGIGV